MKRHLVANSSYALIFPSCVEEWGLSWLLSIKCHPHVPHPPQDLFWVLPGFMFSFLGMGECQADTYFPFVTFTLFYLSQLNVNSISERISVLFIVVVPKLWHSSCHIAVTQYIFVKWVNEWIHEMVWSMDIIAFLLGFGQHSMCRISQEEVSKIL